MTTADTDWIDDEIHSDHVARLLNPERKAEALYGIEESAKDIARATEHLAYALDEAVAHQAWMKDSVLTKMHADSQALAILKTIKMTLILIALVEVFRLFAH